MKKKLLSIMLATLLVGASVTTVKTFATEDTSQPTENVVSENKESEDAQPNTSTASTDNQDVEKSESDGNNTTPVVENNNGQDSNTSSTEKDEAKERAEYFEGMKPLKEETLTIKELYNKFGQEYTPNYIFYRYTKSKDANGNLIFEMLKPEPVLTAQELEQANSLKIDLLTRKNGTTSATFNDFTVNVVGKYIVPGSTFSISSGLSNFVGFDIEKTGSANIKIDNNVVSNTMYAIDTSNLNAKEAEEIIHSLFNETKYFSKEEISDYLSQLSLSTENMGNNDKTADTNKSNSAESSKNASKKSKSPNTADSRELGIFAILALSSLAGIRFAYKK